jgi:hypothetical protein
MVKWIADMNSDKFMVVTSQNTSKTAGKIALPMGMETSSPISKIEDVACEIKA